MSKVIVYNNPDAAAGVILLIPTLEALQHFSLEVIGKKDVPPKVPFWIIDESQLPIDEFLLDAMIIDEKEAGPPSGVGSIHDTFEGVASDV